MPRRVDHDDRRAEIAELAAALIAEHGPDALSLRSLAAAAGSSTTAVTHYFASKKELLLHAYRAAVGRARARVAAIPAGEVDELRACLEAVLPIDTARRQDWRTWLAFFGAAVGDEELSSLQRRRVAEFRRALRGIIEAQWQNEAAPGPSGAVRETVPGSPAAARKRIQAQPQQPSSAGRAVGDRGAEAERQARLLLALVHGIATEAAFDPEDWPAERQLAMIEEQLQSIRSARAPAAGAIER